MALWSDQYQFLVHKTGSIYESLKWPFLHCYYFSPLQFNNWKKKCLYVPSQTTVLKVKGNTTMAIVEMWLTLSSCLFSNIAESLLQVQLISDFFFWKRISSKNRQATVWACDNILISCFLYSDSQMSTYLVGLYGKVISWYVCIFQILSHTSM